MKQIDYRAAQRSTAALRRRGWLVGALLLTCCGGSAAVTEASAVGGASGSSSELAMGGQADGGGQNIYVGIAGMPIGGGGPDVSAGAADVANTSCDTGQLYTAILEGALGGLGTCEFAAPPGAGEKLGASRGAVVLDSVGRVIANTGLPAATKQAWLDQLMDQRWPCLAGQTVGYKCKAAD